MPPLRRSALLALTLAALALATGLVLVRGRSAGPDGNAIVVIVAAAAALDSVVAEPAPPPVGFDPAPGPVGRTGYVAARDSATIALTPIAGESLVRAWRDGRVVAEHVVHFGGRSVFELRIGDRDQAGRYRRTR